MCYKGSRTIDHKIIGRQRTIGRSVRQVKIFKNKFDRNTSKKLKGTNNGGEVYLYPYKHGYK